MVAARRRLRALRQRRCRHGLLVFAPSAALLLLVSGTLVHRARLAALANLKLQQTHAVDLAIQALTADLDLTVRDDRLQDESSTDYVRAARKLPLISVHVSPMELNMEHGRIETPHKPVLRLIRPLLSDATGQRQGFPVFDMLTQRMLEAFAHMGGDELLVVLESLAEPAQAVGIAEQRRVAGQQAIPREGGRVAVSLSIGVALAIPGENVDALIARADQAMPLAKQGCHQSGDHDRDPDGSSGAGFAPPHARTAEPRLTGAWMTHLLISSKELLHNLLIDTAQRPRRVTTQGA